MVSGINNIRFSGNQPDNKIIAGVKPQTFMSAKLKSQPLKDEVAFTGAVIKVKDLLKAAGRLGFQVVKGSGKHGTKLVGNGKTIPIPIGGKTKELATGTANQIAKNMGFSNARELLKHL